MVRGLVYGKQEFAAMAFGSCAALGFVLAITGLFSVMSFIVALRTRDIGIRFALGASQAAILRMTVRQGLILSTTGIVIGCMASLVLTRFLSSQFRGISATDPLTLVLVTAAVMAAGSAACVLPAYRATLVDPITTLRNE
jgi:ABC-type antimicrobial peptide transport system permease subunit